VLGDGAQEKPYLHVSELVDAMLFLFERGRDRLNYYNIAPEIGATTVRFIAEAVVRAAAPKAAIRYTGGSRGWIGDVPKFSLFHGEIEIIGLVPEVKFQPGR